jgi:hypothetical protein
MSYFDGPDKGYGWNAGHFLANEEDCVRETRLIAADHSQVVTRDNGRKVVPAGAIIPSNDAYAEGILYEDIDVTEGAKMGSVVTQGIVNEDMLPAAIESAAEAVLTGITVRTTSPAVTRPDYYSKAWTPLTVSSAEGAASGKTVISVTGVTLGTGEKLQYKAGDTIPDTPTLGGTVTGFTDFDSGDSLTIADGKKVAVVAVTAGGFVFGAGGTTADTKA